MMVITRQTLNYVGRFSPPEATKRLYALNPSNKTVIREQQETLDFPALILFALAQISAPKVSLRSFWSHRPSFPGNKAKSVLRRTNEER